MGPFARIGMMRSTRASYSKHAKRLIPAFRIAARLDTLMRIFNGTPGLIGHSNCVHKHPVSDNQISPLLQCFRRLFASARTSAKDVRAPNAVSAPTHACFILMSGVYRKIKAKPGTEIQHW